MNDSDIVAGSRRANSGATIDDENHTITATQELGGSFTDDEISAASANTPVWGRALALSPQP